MQLNGKVYDVTKQIAQIWIPFMMALYFGLDQIWHHLPEVAEVLGTLSLIDTLLGGLLTASSASYKNSDARFDGALALQDHPAGGAQVRMIGLDTDALLTKKAVTFKIVDQTTPESMDVAVQPNMTDPRLMKPSG